MSNEEKCVQFVPNDDIEIVDNNIMRQSLSSITRELQRFHFKDQDSKAECNVFEIVKQCKENLKSKRKKMKKLNEKIKTACFVASTVMSAKARESDKMKTLVETIENNSEKVIQDNTKLKQIIEDLTKENLKVYNKIDNLNSWINLGYEKLQNLRNQPVEDVSVFNKLKTIIFYCGQYYADYQNEMQRCEQLEQKSRFYYNKLKILESDYKNVTHEVKSLRYQNMMLQRIKYNENSLITNTPVVLTGSAVKNFQKNASEENLSTLCKRKKEPEPFDLSLHLSIVRKLLHDQSTMIQNLNQLSEELNICE
ncbi:PREDICTED: uncharacterized protein LOC106123573 [Papilio xuthus]|uniref:Uncharacterized protein LOC106123573 n=1 Tax=Papilio xuthus TaxID=66420 RepID=A0AAJ6ZM54_PAPXU|nr:PREDICTED: uncharacterized protein LOC106123573 [Papilio xuthus]XP_013175433.1 PREDICTED: uncharacterized protein LOC106123573 [Papilio xuthus]